MTCGLSGTSNRMGLLGQVLLLLLASQSAGDLVPMAVPLAAHRRGPCVSGGELAAFVIGEMNAELIGQYVAQLLLGDVLLEMGAVGSGGLQGSSQ